VLHSCSTRAVAFRQTPARTIVGPRSRVAFGLGKRGAFPYTSALRLDLPAGPLRDGEINCMPWSILLVDDSETSRAPLRNTLVAHGARVIEAENGKQGLLRARTEPVDLIFSDIHMPVMDGLQMIRELRMLREHAKTPIFVLTSDASGLRATEGKNAGATGWIVKPVSPAVLWKVVEKALFGVVPQQSGGASPALGLPTPNGQK
jgi:two-component system, chemotaxis family, chemotaxis protein CheY